MLWMLGHGSTPIRTWKDTKRYKKIRQSHFSPKTKKYEKIRKGTNGFLVTCLFGWSKMAKCQRLRWTLSLGLGGKKWPFFWRKLPVQKKLPKSFIFEISNWERRGMTRTFQKSNNNLKNEHPPGFNVFVFFYEKIRKDTNGFWKSQIRMSVKPCSWPF